MKAQLQHIPAVKYHVTLQHTWEKQVHFTMHPEIKIKLYYNIVNYRHLSVK